jgi:hypothetical protein
MNWLDLSLACLDALALDLDARWKAERDMDYLREQYADMLPSTRLRA